MDPIGDFIWRLLYKEGYLISDQGITCFSNEDSRSQIEIIPWGIIRSITSNIEKKRIECKLWYTETSFLISLKDGGEIPGIYAYLAGLFSASFAKVRTTVPVAI
uniref:Uncharacterized protein n=1 Tax=viral metagenome TaxID=1070528 RepID=A0A6C0CGG8_9ZZZZ